VVQGAHVPRGDMLIMLSLLTCHRIKQSCEPVTRR
jgi:hypothetical protein